MILEYLTRIDKILRKLNKLNDDLESQNPFPAVQVIVQQDFDREFSKFRKECDKDIGSAMYNSYSVKVDNHILENIHRELAKFIDVKLVPVEMRFSNSPEKINSKLGPNLLNQFIQSQSMRPPNSQFYTHSPQQNNNSSQYQFNFSKPQYQIHHRFQPHQLDIFRQMVL